MSSRDTSIQDDACGFCVTSTQFYRMDLITHGFWYLWEILKSVSHGYQVMMTSFNCELDWIERCLED
jgi:hypothetical protein